MLDCGREEIIRAILEHGHLERAAKSLGYSKSALISKIKRLDIQNDVSAIFLNITTEKRRIDICAVLDMIHGRNGALVSSRTDFKGLPSKIKIRCVAGHEWITVAGPILNGRWCRKCHAATKKCSIEKAKHVAEQRGGECLSTTYENSHNKLIWKCSNGHVWEAKYYSVVNNGRWCPQCNSGFSENCCRAFFEAIFGLPFPKIKPTWLRNLNGYLMELDGYCESTGVAFEHNGVQHYREDLFCRDLGKRIEDDARKKELCAEHGVKLIVIPPLFHVLRFEELGKFLVIQFAKLNIIPPKSPKSIIVDKNSIYSKDHSKSTAQMYLQQMKKIAESRDGVCLSSEYIDSQTDMTWKCNVCNHIWEAIPNSIKRGSWCPECYRRSRCLTIEEMRELAASYGGQCLSDHYENGRTPLEWKCAQGHIWKARSHKVKSGSWCNICVQIDRNEGA